MVNHDKPSLLLPAILAWCTLSCKPLQHGGLNPKEPPGSTKTQLCKATIPEPSLLPQVARSNFSCIQEMARQLRGAGKAAKKQNSFKHFFFLQNSAVLVLTLSPFSRAQCPAESGLSFQKQCVLPAFHGQCIQREKRGNPALGWNAKRGYYQNM